MGQPQPHHSIQQRRRGVKGPSASELDELRALWGTMPSAQVAACLGISRATAYRWYQKAVGVSHLHRVSHISGYSAARLAAALGCSTERIWRWVRRGWLERKQAEEADSAPDGEGDDVVEFSDTGVWRLVVQHPLAVFPKGTTAEQMAWLAGMQRTAHQGRVRESA